MNDVNYVNDVNDVNYVNDERCSNGEGELIWEAFFHSYCTLAEYIIKTKSMHARNLAYKRAKRSGKLNHWQAFRTKRNAVANKLKQAK